ncbi:MAG: hypothetical protein OEW09_12695, partial [Anaerolineae bacterium]|nr:hypothetical protein [Anaerolineae bacterium]
IGLAYHGTVLPIVWKTVRGNKGHVVNFRPKMYHLFSAKMYHLFSAKMYHSFSAGMYHPMSSDETPLMA